MINKENVLEIDNRKVGLLPPDEAISSDFNDNVDEIEEDDDLSELEEEEKDVVAQNVAGDLHENNIEWLTGDKRVCASFSQRKWINKIKKLAEENPDEIRWIYNKSSDPGSITIEFPLSWVRINKPRKMSQEQKDAMSARAKKMKEEGRGIFAKRK